MERSTTVEMMFTVLLLLLIFNSDVARGNSSRIELSHLNLEKVEGASIVVTCKLDNAIELKWINKQTEEHISDDLAPIRVEAVTGDTLQLIFTNLTMAEAGTYMCKGRNGAKESSEKFDLKVKTFNEHRIISFGNEWDLLDCVIHNDEPCPDSRENHGKLGFVNPLSDYYVSLGAKANLTCKPNIKKPKPLMKWQFQNQDINYTGQIFVNFDDGESITILNVTNDLLGTYLCRALEPNTGDIVNHYMQLRLATSPKIIEVHKGNNVRALMHSVAQLRCKVTAGPPASIFWYRYNKKIKSTERGNLLIETKDDNESVLKVKVNSNHDLGVYTCEAFNELGATNYSFILAEGEKPKAPKIHPREEVDTGYKFDIRLLDPSANLTNFRVLFKKKNDNYSNDWMTCDLDIKEPDEAPYMLSNLLTDTEYIFKVGACTDVVNICEFSEEREFRTLKATTSYANFVGYSFTAHIFVLLPAFVVNFYSQQHSLRTIHFKHLIFDPSDNY